MEELKNKPSPLISYVLTNKTKQDFINLLYYYIEFCINCAEIPQSAESVNAVIDLFKIVNVLKVE